MTFPIPLSDGERAAAFFGKTLKKWATVPTWHSMWNYERGEWRRRGVLTHGDVVTGEIQCAR